MSNSSPTHIFLHEAEDLLSRIEEIALEVRPGESASESIHQLFRAFHTIKGSGGMFGYDEVADFTHHVETALDKVREGLLPFSQDLVRLVLASKDQIQALLEAAQGGPSVQSESVGQLVRELNALSSAPTTASAPVIPSAASAVDATPGETKAQTYRIQFRPPAGLMASGTNPLMLLNDLRKLGTCQVQADTVCIPPLETLQADSCYLAWNVVLTTSHGLNSVRDVFIFVEEESELKIEVVPADELAGCGRDSALESPSIGPDKHHPPNAPTPSGAATVRTASNRDATTIRVPSDRLDRLVALVGELVMNQSRLTQVAASDANSNLSGPVEELERLVAELRDTVLGIRMMPIGTTFNRYKRLVHDLSVELTKEIQLVTAGGETELDKTVLDQLGDPLVHLIRNSIDHGIEPATDREAAGKPSQGTIRLTAAHTGSNVVVTIQDDGRGLDPDRIRTKAIEKQLIAPDTNLSREEIFNLIFLPGFSTAEKVTNVSGRGVGMDVVRRQIEVLRGSIRLKSDPGAGTEIALTLPLTLAIIDGLLVEVGDTQFILPMSSVAENVDLPRANRSRSNGRNLIAVRGELIPYLRLRDEFGISGGELDPEKVVVVHQGPERVGLVVDRVLGSHQTVIQSLGRFYRNVEVVSGATIMGDGRVGLILDLSGILKVTTPRNSTHSPVRI